MSNPSPSKGELLAFAKYVRSYLPGRVRVRHPGLRNPALARESKRMLEAREGVRAVEVNLVSGSALITYDDGLLDKDAVIAIGVEWARWLDGAA